MTAVVILPRDRPTRPVLTSLSRAAGVLTAGALLFTAPEAGAQTIGPADTARGVTVLSRPRPDYDPLGVRLPGFRLDGSLDAGLGYDDNTSAAGSNKRSSSFAEEQLQLSLNSTYTRHALGLTASQTTRKYFGDDDYSWNDYDVGMYGRYDIGRASSIGLEYSHVRSHIDVTSFEVQRGTLTQPLPFDTDTVRLNGVAALNRVNLTGALDYRTYRFDEKADPTFRGGSTSANDYSRVTGEAGAAYVILPGRSLTVLTRLTDISYDQANQRGRNSFTWEVLGGARYDLTGLAWASFGIGYRQRDYNDPNLHSISGPAFEGQLTLIPSQLLTVTLGVQRTIEESIRASNAAYIRTSAWLGGDYELRRNVILSGQLRGDRLEYRDPGETITQGVALLSARLLLNRSASVTLSYQHVRSFESATSFQEFDRNVLQLRLRLAI